MKAKLFDITAPDREIYQDILKDVAGLFERGQFILGAEVKEFESELAARCGVSHGIGVASGTDALILALRALGVGPGDEVITSPFTFGASAGSVTWLGAKPVFVDIDPETMNLDPARVRSAITERTKAILPVHLFGLPAAMDELMDLAGERDLPVIEDAAQAIGARFRNRPVGSLGHVACFSFYPTKNLGAYGDGGGVVTDSEEISERVRLLRGHGSRIKYIHTDEGTNSRLDEVQACVLRHKLKKLDEWTERRREQARIYERELGDCRGVRLPRTPEGYEPVYHLYTLRVEDPDGLSRELTARGIGNGRYYPQPLHRMPAFADCGVGPGDLPCAEEASRTCLSVPIHPALPEGMVAEVARDIREILSSR